MNIKIENPLKEQNDEQMNEAFWTIVSFAHYSKTIDDFYLKMRNSENSWISNYFKVGTGSSHIWVHEVYPGWVSDNKRCLIITE